MTDSALTALDRIWKEKAIAARNKIPWSGVSYDNVDAVIFYGDYGGAIALANMYIERHKKQ